jgi:hypothetical protein
MNRREMIGGLAGALVPFTGCLSSIGGGSGEMGVILTNLSINNKTNTSQMVAVSVLYDGEWVFSQTYNIGPKKGNVAGGQVIDIPPANEPGKVEIHAAMNDQIKVRRLAERYEAACLQVQIWIESTERLTFKIDNKGTACFNKYND